MRKLNKILSILLLSGTVLLSSCGKDDEAKKNNTELLTSKTWMYTKVEMSYGGQTVDISSYFLQECEKDNTMKFSKDGKYEASVGTNDCDGEEENESGTWAWKSNETIISATVGGSVEDFKIVSISSNILKVNSGPMDFDMNGDGINDQNVELILTFEGK